VSLPQWLNPEVFKLLLVLFLSFLIGLQREERKVAEEGRYAFGGVRTFPLIGVIGYLIAFLSGPELLPLVLGFATVAGFLMLSYWHKLTTSSNAGITSEMTGLATYLVGALVYREQFWIATAVSVASLVLLELKVGLEGLARRIASDDILTFAKFLLVTAVILPVLPDAGFTPYDINPHKTWLVVAAVSAVSYGSYALQRLMQGRGGLMLAAVLGGMYSSTTTTVALARRSQREGGEDPHLFAGSIVIASGVMYLRLIVLLGIFNRALMSALAPSFAALAAIAIGAGWYWCGRAGGRPAEIEQRHEPKNPLELGTAFAFAIVFVVMLVATHLALDHFGRGGVYLLATAMGVSDVDPFVMGMTQAAPGTTPLALAAAAILIAAAANNVAKGVYACSLGSRAAGRASLALLLGLAALGIAPLAWL
jgi:uncharacterized membrane protein (DUF4010 family)